MFGELRPVGLADQYRAHPLLAGQWFFVLPSELWDDLLQALGPSRFDAELLALEREVACQAEGLPGCVGYHNGRPVIDTFLRPTPTLNVHQPLVADYLARCAQAGYRCDDLMTALTERVPALREPQQAYLGWLFTTPEFLQEFRGLQRAHPTIFSPGLCWRGPC